MSDIPELKSPTTGDSSTLVSANYNKLSDHIRRLTPQGIQCSVFCGGVNCKYENPESWTADNLAVHGIYSNWITNRILAMARPSTVIIIKKNIIHQFQSLGIKSIINLQCPKEHASCGQPLENSGFSYDPNIFMENDIYYYNFAWKDYGDATLAGLVNMVKVLAFAVNEGRVVVHCHAGLGRTGVLISCYLVYSLRVSANDAIKYVRHKRPGSVQTRGQIICVRHFAQYILPQTITFYLKDNINRDKYMSEFTLQRFLRRQKIYLHGYDERNYKYIPKIIDKICERLLKICRCYVDDKTLNGTSFTIDYICAKLTPNMQRHESTFSICSSPTESLLPNSTSCGSSEILSVSSPPLSPNPSENGDHSDSFSELDSDDINYETLLENKCFQQLETEKIYDDNDNDQLIVEPVRDIREVIEALLIDSTTLDNDTKKLIKDLENDINNSQIGWKKLESENNLFLLTSLLYDWIETLKAPILNRDNLEVIVINYKQPDVCLSKFDIEVAYLIEYLMRFMSKLQPISKDMQDCILKRFIAAITKQSIVIGDNLVPTDRGFNKFRDGTLKCTIIFFESLFTMIDIDQRHKRVLQEMNDNLKINNSDDEYDI